jgi:hypothetical protein
MGVIVYMLLKFRERYNGTFTRELVTDTYKKSTQMKGNVGYLKVVVLKGWLSLYYLPPPHTHTRAQLYLSPHHLILTSFLVLRQEVCHVEDS